LSYSTDQLTLEAGKMRAFILALAGAGATAQVSNYTKYSFDSYLAEFDKSYAEDAYQQRKEIFDQNLKKIVQHNQEYQSGDHTWWAAVNHLTDSTAAEFQKLRSTKYSPSQHPVAQLTKTQANPDALDWQEKGALTAVKNQGGCGSCWAFSATETIESFFQIASGKLVELAPQTFVNCVKDPNTCGGTGGCEGATMELAFNLTRDQGIATESDLPYQGVDQKCSSYTAAVKATGYVKNPTNDADALETALATQGPISITVAAEPWQFYGGGVFSGCSKGMFSSSGSTLDHGVQLVGYSQDYWRVRNSWGAGWGEKGFIRISRANDAKTFTDKKPADGVACKPLPKSQTVGGECGMLFDTSYPTGVTDGGADAQVIV